MSTSAFADSVADRQAEYLNAYYDAFRSDSGYGTDARVTINTAYTTFALGKPFADVFDANSALDQYFTANADMWVGRRGENLALVPSYWELTTLSAMVTDPGLSQYITPGNQTKIKDYLFSFATELGTADRPSVDADKRTRIFESDNHDPHHAVVHWMTAQALKDDPAYANVSFPGGNTPEQRYGQWTTKLLDYFQDRAGKGGTVEVGSTVYTLIYTNTVFQVAEYAQDPRLKEIARSYLDLQYADMAQETVESIRAGAKSRSTKERSLWSLHERSGVYIYPFVGEPAGNLTDLAALDAAPREEHMARLFGGALTTDYRVPDVIADLYRDDDARGSYSYVTSRLAEGTLQTLEQEKVYFPTEDQSAFLRTTTVTPKYALGWFTVDENKEYMAISSQAQMMSVVTDATRESRLVFNLTGGRELNELQAVGYEDAVLIKKQDKAPVGELPRVYVSNDFTYASEPDGWVFGTDGSGSYFAVQGVLHGAADTFTLVDASADNGQSTTGGNYLTFSNEATVMVVQMGLISDYASFADFKADVRDNTLSYDAVDGALTYDPGTPITLFDDRRVPKVNGQAVDLTPDKVYDSPYLSADYGSDVVHVTGLDGSTLELDFAYNPVAPTQQRTTPANTTQTGVFSPGYREMVGVTEYSSDSAGDPLVYEIDPAGVLEIDFDGFHDVVDRLVIRGELRLGGELLVNTIRDTPTRAGVFQVLEADTITGAFDTITLPSVATDLVWRTDRLAVDGTLSLLQLESITLGDTDNTSYGPSNPDDNPPIDAAFEADIRTQLNPAWDLKGLDEDDRNDIRAMTFSFDPLDPAGLDSVWVETRLAGLGGYENDVMVLDVVGNHRRLDAMQGFVTGGGWMTLRYELDSSEFALLADGQLNLAFFDDVRVDWVTMSWLSAPAAALLGDLDSDGDLDVTDIDLLASSLGIGVTPAEGDLDDDGDVDLDDLTAWLALAGTINGDANLDGDVGTADLAILAGNFGNAATSFGQCDFNLDGMVGTADLAILAGNFGQAAASAQAPRGTPAVPEPATLALAGIVAVGAQARRRFHAQH